ncbi:actin-like protein Arp6 [Acrasis kona]|uniref:Actin-like protein Arp6 n=1 Tax=Acrasis kona TaxID=1008807 RepID=A0AAW2YWT9_9EUKA
MQQRNVDHHIIVMDNGGGSCKVGFAGERNPKIIPNVIAKAKSTGAGVKGKAYIGDELENCENYSSLVYKRPIEKGYVVDCETQIALWNRIFSADVLNVTDFADRHIFLTHQPFTPNIIKSDLAQVVFEHFGFKEYTSLSGSYCAFNGFLSEHQYNPTANPINASYSAVVVDSGFSFTNITPIVNHGVQKESIRRIDIGGKALTNYLKEIVSLRYYDMMDETYLMNVIKERLCFVSLDFMKDMNIVKNVENEIQRHYILPDYRNTRTGFVKQDDVPLTAEDQVLSMNNERITVPEVLFTPSDIGSDQAGIPEAIVQSVSSTQEIFQNVLYDCILLVGGNTCFPNYKKRIEKDMRKYVNVDHNITVHQPSDPVVCCWRGASSFAGSETGLARMSSTLTVTKKEYEEHGSNICIQKFSQS